MDEWRKVGASMDEWKMDEWSKKQESIGSSFHVPFSKFHFPFSMLHAPYS